MHLVRGQKVKAFLQADATQSFIGALDEILPEVSTSTRTLKARFEVDNRNAKLVPGMLLRLRVAGASSLRLLVPAEAVIRTGKRVVFIVRKPEGAFELRDVSLGADMGEEVEVVSGLANGDQVVVSGQFLIDSEARLRSVLGSLSPAVSASPLTLALPSSPAAVPSAIVLHTAQGRVESVAPGCVWTNLSKCGCGKHSRSPACRSREFTSTSSALYLTEVTT